MATGLDTDSIVKKLMSVEQVPLDQLKQKQQKDLWLSDTYRQWNTNIFSFNSATLFPMKLSSAYNNFDVTSSLQNSVSGTGTSSAFAGNYTVSVDQLADSATFTGTNVTVDSTKSLADQSDSNYKVTANTSFTIKVGSQSAAITIDPSMNLSDIVSNINNATDSNGKSLGLQAIYDSNLKQFIVRTKATGASAKIDLDLTTTSQEGKDFLKNALGVDTSTDTPSTTGKNAIIYFNGTKIDSLSSNNATIMGISLTLKSPTKDSSGNLLTSNISVSQNVDAEVKNIKDFIDKYNDLLSKLNTANSEAVYKDYQPLTDDQRTAMSETQITQWETKAKSGLLHNDSIIKNVINQMRNTMTSIISNGSTYNSLASIGISSKSYQDQGKLYVDETKLRAAIQADPDGVRNLFSQIGDSSKGTNGLINRLSETMNQAVKDLTNKAGLTGSSQYDESTIGKMLTRIQSDITKQSDRMNTIEDQYYKQFAAMESAVNKYNSQSSWLTQQMGLSQ
jgi:flagellar hook-associated protein 2